MQAKQGAELLASIAEQREFERNAVNLPGKQIVPAENITLPCHVLSLSSSGASVRCEDTPPPFHSTDIRDGRALDN
jgi:hypothetical protein